MPNLWDYLIVGQGLAGSLLAWELTQQGRSVLLIDNQHKTSSSIVAAGLMNPITGKRLVMQPKVRQHLSVALPIYQQLADFFQCPFYHAVAMRRILLSEQQKNYYSQRQQDPLYQPYMGDWQASTQHLNTPLGSFKQEQTGFLDVPLLLDKIGLFFTQHQQLKKTDFNYDDVHFAHGQVHWQGQIAKGVIFCEGYQGMNNPWFDLPFQPSKGELLTLTIKDFHCDDIVNAGMWLLPIGNHQYRLGATNDWHHLNEHITEQASLELLAKLSHWLNAEFEINIDSQLAGVRPTTRDKFPFIGESNQQQGVYCFNGFGAHGSLHIPYYAQRFVEHLLYHVKLPHDADIQRLNYAPT